MYRPFLFRKIFTICLLLLSIVSSLSFAAPRADYQIKIFDKGAELTLVFPAPVEYTLKQMNQNRVLSFNEPLDISDLQVARKTLDPWLQEISASYDSLLLKLRKGVEIGLSNNEHLLHIKFNNAEKNFTDDLSVRQHQQPNSSFERVKARLLYETGKITQSRQRYYSLLKLHPKNTGLMLDLASVEERLNNWREALYWYQQAESLKPYDYSAIRDKQNLLRAHGSGIKTRVQYSRIGKDNTQVKTEINARQLVKSGQIWFADYALWNVDNNFITQSVNGSRQTFDGVRYSVGLGVESRLFDGEQITSLFLDQENIGAGLSYKITNNVGSFNVYLDWQRPWLETSEALAGIGFQDRLGFQYETSLLKNFNVRSNLSVNSYGLKGIDNASKSYRLIAEASYWFAWLPDEFYVAYSFDREYVYSLIENIDSSGKKFTVFPIDEHALHRIVFGWNTTFSNLFLFESLVGFEQDQIRNAQAPFVQFNLTYRPRPKFEVHANIESGLTTYNEGNDDFLTFGAGMNWYF